MLPVLSLSAESGGTSRLPCELWPVLALALVLVRGESKLVAGESVTESWWVLSNNGAFTFTVGVGWW